MTVMNPKQIQKIHKFLTPPFTTEVAVTPDMLKDRKEITIFLFSPFFLVEFCGYVVLWMPFHKGGAWRGQEDVPDTGVW